MLRPSALLEALLFASGEPLEKKRALMLLGVDAASLESAVEALSNDLADRGLTLIQTDTELELRTAAGASDVVTKLRESELSRDLGKASLETLAVIAYKPGSTRSEIDWVRGVNSGASMRTLLLRGLVEGKEDPADKRRVRYTLTPEALAHLGVSQVAALPRYDELSLAAAAAAEAPLATES